MNARSRRLVGGASMALAAGCGGPGEVASGAAAGTPTRSGVDPTVAVALAIRMDPAATDSILAAHEMTREGFDSLMYDVAADAERARAYTRAMVR